MDYQPLWEALHDAKYSKHLLEKTCGFAGCYDYVVIFGAEVFLIKSVV